MKTAVPINSIYSEWKDVLRSWKDQLRIFRCELYEAEVRNITSDTLQMAELFHHQFSVLEINIDKLLMEMDQSINIQLKNIHPDNGNTFKYKIASRQYLQNRLEQEQQIFTRVNRLFLCFLSKQKITPALKISYKKNMLVA